MKHLVISQPHKLFCFCSLRPIASFDLILASLCALGSVSATFAQHFEPPPGPAVAPLVSAYYANDLDADKIDDKLLDRAQKTIAAERAAVSVEEKSQTRARAAEMVNVELVFKEQVTQKQIDTFTALGGEITYIYKAVSYGWNARIPLNKISAVPAAMGASLLLVDEGKLVKGDLDEATRIGRVRPVWSSGFAENVSGFAGTTNITIAFIDSGLDETHIDLTGRGVYWTNFTDELAPTPVDLNGHGSHVAGIALGTGQAGGVSGPLFFTHFGDEYRGGNPPPAGSFVPNNLHLPITSSTFSMTAKWLGGGSTSFNRYSRTNGDMGGFSLSASSSGLSPLTITTTTVFNPSRIFTPGLLSVSGPTVSNFVVTGYVSNYPAVDSFNRLRGVAPGCNWAAAKDLRADNTGISLWAQAALDDLVANRVAKNIKLINMSQTDESGANAVLRQKVNSTVMNGVLVVTGTGNTGKAATASDRQARDPSRAALALTACAANDICQLTDYTSQGFSAPDSTPGQEEDYKPDLMAPGGSDYYSFILSVDSNNNDGPEFPDQRTNDYIGLHGTSMAVPFACGCAALVIEAVERTGVIWDFGSSEHPRLVKMVLCATASESNTNREGNLDNPTLQRASSITNGFEVLPAGKDLYEGYGAINADAAVEAVSLIYTNGTVATNSLGPAMADRRVWARTVNLLAGRNFRVTLTNPATGDFDLYLYNATPSAYGTPILLAASTQAGGGATEILNFSPVTDQKALVVVKRVSGSGSFSLQGIVAPAVDFTADITNGLAPLTVNFTNLTSGIANSYIWSFGDGGTSTSADTAHTYTNAGTYSVTLSGIGPGGTNNVRKANLIVVTNEPLPNIDFVADPTSGQPPLTVFFTSLTAGATSYLWAFGDGHFSTDKNPSNTFTNTGNFTVTLTAIGPGGTTNLSRNQYILITNPPPVAAFDASPVAGFAPLTVYFTNLSSGASEFAWDFGNGDTSTNSIPVYTYSSPGTYTVTLGAVGPSGTNTLSRSGFILVSAIPSILSPTVNGDDFTFAFETVVGTSYVIEYKDSLDDSDWQTLVSIPGDGSPKIITNSISAVSQRFFRLNVQ
jgi:PKD repeat protein